MSDPFDLKGPRRPRSVSQLQQYEKCPYAYYLARVEREWRRPAAWLAQGVAVHAAAEAWERSGRSMPLEAAQAVFDETYRKVINEACAETPNFNWWFRSGRYRGKEDITRRYKIGLEQVEKYIRYYQSHPGQVIWVAEDGTPGIELAFDVELGGVPVIGYIDAVIVDEDGEVIVRDNKTGAQPGDDFQLATYAVALSEQFGIPAPERGDYWMGKSGKVTVPYDLTDWPVDRVGERFAAIDEGITAERFDPTPDSDKCRFCDVSHACDYAC